MDSSSSSVSLLLRQIRFAKARQEVFDLQNERNANLFGNGQNGVIWALIMINRSGMTFLICSYQVRQYAKVSGPNRLVLQYAAAFIAAALK